MIGISIANSLGLNKLSGPSEPLLLDTYSSAAVAYSLRKLRTAYAGSAIRVRRSSDNTEQNIGFVSGNLDTASLISFCGAGNGFVTTWYDQSGNGVNFTQSSAANQPQIVSSGAVLIQGGKPSISFNGTTHNLDCATTTISTGNSSLFITMQKALGDANVLATASGSAYYYLSYTALQYYGTTGAVDTNVDFNKVDFALISVTYDTTAGYKFYRNNSLKITRTNTAIGSQSFNRLCGSAFGPPSPQNISEIISYPTNQITNRNDINNNINTYYAIY
jgi:hypothetical protein